MNSPGDSLRKHTSNSGQNSVKEKDTMNNDCHIRLMVIPKQTLIPQNLKHVKIAEEIDNRNTSLQNSIANENDSMV